MPSDPDTGPIRMSTLSCSTSLRAPRIAESGLALVGKVTISIVLPPALAPACFTAISVPRSASSPSAVSAPSRVARTPILIFSCASAAPAQRLAAATADNNVLFMGVILPSVPAPISRQGLPRG
jgi:hypothetical protein